MFGATLMSKRILLSFGLGWLSESYFDLRYLLANTLSHWVLAEAIGFPVALRGFICRVGSVQGSAPH